MNDVTELMTSLVNVQSAGVKAGLQAGESERARLERERDQAIKLLQEFVEHYEGPRERYLNGVSLTHFHHARALLAKHGRAV